MVNDGDFYISETTFWKLAKKKGVFNYAPNLNVLLFPVMSTDSMGLTFITCAFTQSLPWYECYHLDVSTQL